MPVRPKAVVFDIIETVFALEPMRRRLAGLGLPPNDLETWFAFGLRDAFAIAATGAPPPFPKILAGALDALLAVRGLSASESERNAALDGMKQLPPQPQAGEAFGLLQQAGLPIFALSNGTEAATRALLETSGLIDHVEAVLSVEAVHTFKPHAEVYRHAVERAGVAPHEAMLVATHAWDTQGAKAAGLQAAFVARGQAYPPEMLAPDVTGEDLVDVAKAILALPQS
ncbi:haloacid dehalogenase type II [Jiella sp. M17.18]|uniref:haloacid dehalogenase type II n=1 Tax=Jiella sp. M17.18 TaxID=3234247 RepID=UPI0034DF14D2